MVKLLPALVIFCSVSAHANSGIWIHQSQLMGLPTSGVAWDTLRANALNPWPAIDLAEQSEPQVMHNVFCQAGALYYARTGDTAVLAKLRAGLLAAKRSFDDPLEYNPDVVDPKDSCEVAAFPKDCPRILALGRQIGGYAIAAGTAGLQNDAEFNAEFAPWLSFMRTVILVRSTGDNWKSLVITHEKTANNWGSFAGASLIAIDVYLGDTVDLARRANIFRAWAGERSYYPTGLPWGSYFQPTSDWDASWICDPPNWVGVNPACTLSGINVDGAIVEDICREGSLVPPPLSNMNYSWETLQANFVQAELLERQGYASYIWSNSALKRAMDFMVRYGWAMEAVAEYVPWIANRRYLASYQTLNPIRRGQITGYTNWTHAPGGGGAPPCIEPPPCPMEDYGLEQPPAETRAHRQGWLDLTGRKLTTQPETPGVYFFNGKKVLVLSRGRIIVAQ